MNKNSRSQACKSEHCACIVSNHSRKSKKRTHRKSDTIDWHNDDHNENNTNVLPETYDHFRQHSSAGIMPQTLPIQNGQRLFTAISDPSVCSFPGMPMTYTMEPVSLPQMYRFYQPVSPGPNFRATRSDCRRSSGQNHLVPHHGPPDVLTNGCRSLRKNGSCQVPASMCQQIGDYASLPPTTANMDNKSCKDELGSEHRRYSDPGLGPLDTEIDGDDSDSPNSGSSITTISQSNKLVMTLVEQMTALKETNNQLFKELHRTKEDLQNVKAELNRLKQGATTGYQPGMLSDIIRELRDSSRIREDAMLTRVRSLLDEKSPNSQEVENLKTQLENLSGNKSENDKRISRLEEELAAVKLSASNGNQREIAAFEEENLSLRRELQEARASRNLAERHGTKLEKLVKMLRKRMQPDSEDASETKSGKSGDSASKEANLEEEALFSDDPDSFTDDSKSASTNNSNNSLSGPVTDL